MGQRVQCDLNPWLPRQHTPAHTRSIRVAGCFRQLVRPWCPGPQACHRTEARAQGGVWRARTGSLSWKLLAGRFAEGHSITPDSTLTLQGPSARSVSLGGRKDLFFLLAATDFLSSRTKSEQISMLKIALRKASSSCHSIEPTAAHLPLIPWWVRGSTPVSSFLSSLSLSLCWIYYSFTEQNNNLLHRQTTNDLFAIKKMPFLYRPIATKLIPNVAHS